MTTTRPKIKSQHSDKNCYLCGKTAETKDHIPPRGIFPNPRPDNLITVPACLECNNSTSQDDEYFRLIVAAGSRDSPQSHVLLKQRILPRAKGSPTLINNFLKSVRKTPVVDRTGTIVGHVPEVSFDRERIQIVIDKIVRGLFLRHTGKYLPLQYRVDKFQLNPPFDEDLQTAVVRLPIEQIGDGSIFNYRYHVSDEIDFESYWFLMFYNNSTLFVTSTSPLTDPAP